MYISPNTPARLMVLGGDQPTDSLDIVVVTTAGKTLVVSGVAARLAPHTAVRIDVLEYVILGEIRETHSDETPVLIRHFLHTTEIAEMRRGWV